MRKLILAFLIAGVGSVYAMEPDITGVWRWYATNNDGRREISFSWGEGYLPLYGVHFAVDDHAEEKLMYIPEFLDHRITSVEVVDEQTVIVWFILTQKKEPAFVKFRFVDEDTLWVGQMESRTYDEIHFLAMDRERLYRRIDGPSMREGNVEEGAP